MSEDIQTLLRDAGRGPTRDLDVAGVHDAGLRRARTRTLATGVGALALLAVVGVGINALLPGGSDLPVIDQPPSQPEPVPDEAMPAEGAAVPQLAATIARVVRGADGGELEVTLTAPDGTTTVFATDQSARDDLAGSVLFDGQGRVVLVSADGDLVRADPDGSTVLAAGDSQAGTPWNVHGTTEDGEPLVSRRDLAGNDELQVVRGDALLPWPLQPVIAPTPEEAFGSATAVGDRLVVTLGVGDSVRWLLYDGGAAPIEVLSSSTMPFDDVPHTPVIVDDQLWYLETQASDDPDGGGPQDLVLRREDGQLRIPTPYGRDLAAFVGAVSVGRLADGGPALLLSSIARDGSGPGTPLLVDLDAARSVATTSGGGAPPDGVFFELGEPGHLLFVP